MRDPYQVLGLTRAASPEQVKKAYRRLARRHHPDRNPDDPGAADRFKEIAEAYGVLSDPRRRAAWDRTGRRDTERRAADEQLEAFLRTFDQQVQLMGALFFDEILPRLLDAYYRGQGVELLARVLDDLEQHRLLTRAAGPEPSEASRERARQVAAACRVTWRPVEMVDATDRPVLGHLHQELAVAQGRLGFRYRIELYPGSFLTTGVRSADALGAAILPIIARECVRYLETFVPEADRPLYAREAQAAGMRPDRISVAAARRRDDRFLLRRWGGLVLFVLIVLGFLAVILPGFA